MPTMNGVGTTMIEDVEAFHRVMGVPVKYTPEWPSDERKDLRQSLISEECLELVTALYHDDKDMAYVAREIADLIYVCIGTALEFGIDLERVWNEVHRSNMANVDPVTGKVRRREDGKILKPEGWMPPDLSFCRTE